MKKIFGYGFAGIGLICGLIIGIQMAILEVNWNYFPTRDYQVGMPSGMIDLMCRFIETFQMLLSPEVLPVVIVGLISMGISNALLR